MFSECLENEDGSVTIPTELVRRWRRLESTKYNDLTEKEKHFYREQVVKFLDELTGGASVLKERFKISWIGFDIAYKEYAKLYGYRNQSMFSLERRGGFAVSELNDLLPQWKDYILP